MIKYVIILTSILLILTKSLFSGTSMSYNVNTDAYCECNGSVTIYGYMGLCPWWTNVTYLEIEEWDETTQSFINNQILDYQTYDPSVSTVSLSHTFNNLCPGKVMRARFMFNASGTQTFMSMTTDDLYGWIEINVDGPDEFLDASIVSVVNGSCSGTGSATITTSGGNGGNTIVWKKNGQVISEGNGQTYLGNLTDGSYTVTITDSKGCQKILSFTIDNTYDPIDYDIEVTNSGCNGSNTGEIKICNLIPNSDYYVSKATSPNDPPIDYVIINNCYVFSGIGASNRTITVIHIPSGCPITIQVPIIEFPELIVTPIVKQSGCDGGMSSGRIELDITSGTAPYTYEWSHNSNLNSNIADNLSPGTYTVTVTDANGCEKTFEIVITQVPELSLAVQVRDVNSTGNCCSLATAIVSGGTPPFTFKWDDNSTNQTNTKCTFPATHTVTVTDAMGCTYTEQVTNTACGGGLVPVPYPNPNNGQFNIDFTISQSAQVDFELYDGFVKVKSKNNGVLGAGLHTINWNTSLSPGMYTLVIWTNGQIEQEGVLVQIQ